MKYRDVTLLDLTKDTYVAITCDSCGGIGDKPHDVVRASPEVVGYETTKVALFELLSMKVTPKVIINGLCVEMVPTGQRILAGIQKALEELSLEDAVEITGSTEENMPVEATGLSMSIMGVLTKSAFMNRARTKAKDVAVLFGRPLKGEEFLAAKKEDVMDLLALQKLLSHEAVIQVVPLGSKGLQIELEALAKENELAYSFTDEGAQIKDQSSGPASSVLVTLEEKHLPSVAKALGKTYGLVAIFKERGEA